MKKRLRKKKFIGEYKELGVIVKIKIKSGTDPDKFLVNLLIDGMEQNGAYFCGSCGPEVFDGIIELGRFKYDLNKRFELIKKWLDDCEDVENVEYEKLIDLWYGEELPMETLKDSGWGEC
eukprot:Anaeramoba_ignava/a106535_10.p1 GENE.a106535_10~~a106535_10.p1  ORF type:complete len:120 (+),score=6.24 a106535_10:158-517(+)